MKGAVQGVATTTASTPVKKAPVVPPLRRQALADAGEAAADLEHAGEVEADHEEEIGDQQREDRRLELEAPAHLADGGADRDDDRRHGGEGDQHARGVGDAVAPHRAPLVAGQPREGRGLHGEHREHAGHQVQDQPAQQREQQRLDERQLLAAAAASGSDAAARKPGSSLADDVEGLACSPSPVFSVSTSVPASCGGRAALASPFFSGMRMPSALIAGRSAWPCWRPGPIRRGRNRRRGSCRASGPWPRRPGSDRPTWRRRSAPATGSPSARRGAPCRTARGSRAVGRRAPSRPTGRVELELAVLGNADVVAHQPVGIGRELQRAAARDRPAA